MFLHYDGNKSQCDLLTGIDIYGQIVVETYEFHN